MNKTIKLLSSIIFSFSLTSLNSCALGEFFKNNEAIVDLGNGDRSIKWNLVVNDNKYHTVESAYFEFNNKNFKYYEDGKLKKEGTHRITYAGETGYTSPLHLNLDFGKNESGLSLFDYIDCYTEDKKENLHQFTIIREAYHITPLRSGGVPVRDYHLSEMPYAFGTYLKESSERETYKNKKVNYLNCSYLDGTFMDEKGNKFYFLNNSYSYHAKENEYAKYTINMRYENNQNSTFIEGTIFLSYYNEFDTNKYHDVAMIYVLHGEGEPAKERGVSVLADYQLLDFTFNESNSFSFTSGSYFSDNKECDYNPSNFIPGTYNKVMN